MSGGPFDDLIPGNKSAPGAPKGFIYTAPANPTKPPEGYRWTNGPGSQLIPIPGGPKDPATENGKKPDTGYRMNPDGSEAPIPGGPADVVMDPAAAHFYAEQILGGGQSPSFGFGASGAKNRTMVMNEVARIAGAQGLTGADLDRQIAHYKAGSQQLKTLENQLGTIRMNEQTALANGQQFIDRSNQLPLQTGSPALNSIIQFGQKETPGLPGHDEIAAHNAAWNTFVTEYAKVVAGSPSGAGTLSDSARHEAMAVMQGNYAPDQKVAAFNQMKADMANRITAAESSINDGYKHLTETPGYQVPNTLNEINVSGQNGGNKGPAAPPPPTLGSGGPGGNPRAPSAPGALGIKSPDYSTMGSNQPGSTLAATDPNSKLGAFHQTYRDVYDPVVASGLNGLIHKGASIDEANAYLTSHGYNPIADQGQYNAALQYAKQPGHDNVNLVSATQSVPTTLGERLASSPAAEFLAGGAAGGTAGLSDVVGRTLMGPEWDANRQALTATHGTADTLGNIAGGTVGAVVAPQLLARYAPGALGAGARIGQAIDNAVPGLARITGNAAYGGLYGADEDPNNPLAGAATGALTGAVAGKLGEKAAGGMANIIAPPEGSFGPLYQAGGFPTIGQRFGQSGIVGRALNTAEQAMQSFPGLGAMVARARDIPRDAAQIGAFNDALGELAPFQAAGHDVPTALPAGTQPGTAPHAFISDAFNQAYPIARQGMQMVPNEGYQAATQDFANKWFPLLNTEQQGQLSNLIKGSVTDRLKNNGGILPGPAFQQAASDVGTAAKLWSGSDPLLGQAASDFGGILDNAARASSDPQAAALLDAADNGYAKYAGVIRPASARVGGDPGEFTMKAFDRSVQNNASGPDGSQYLKGNALMQPYADAIRPLGDVLSNSGTGERLLTNRLFMGEQAGAGAAGATALGLGAHIAPGALAPFAAYAPGANYLFTRAIAPRQYVLPQALADPLNLAGSQIKQYAPLVGNAAVPGALAYYGVAQ